MKIVKQINLLEKIEELLKTKMFVNNNLNHLYFKLNDKIANELRVTMDGPNNSFLLITYDYKLNFYKYNHENYHFKLSGCYLEDISIIYKFDTYEDLFKYLHK